MKKLFALATGLLMVAGCEHGPQVAAPLVPQPVSASGSLSPEARARLRESVDLNALDRLLGTLRPEEQARLLATFEDVERAVSGRTEEETRSVSIIVRFSDPERQRLLEHTWAPFWAQLPPSVLFDPAYPLPGRTLALLRSADSTLAVKKESEP